MFKRSDMEKKKKAEERAMFKTLSFHKKVEHIFTYYKYVFLCATIAVVIIVSLINTVFLNPPQPTFVRVSIYGKYMTPNQIVFISYYLQGNLDESIRDNQRVRVDNFFFVDGHLSLAQSQRFNGQLFSRELDVLIFTEAYFNHLLLRELFLDLRYIFDEDELAAFGDRLIYAHYHQNLPDMAYEDLELTPYVIQLMPGSYLSELKHHDDDLFIAIVRNTQRLNNAEEMVRNIVY